MLYWMCQRCKGHPLSSLQLEHAICRNFGGLESEEIKPLQVFHEEIGHIDNSLDLIDDQNLDDEVINNSDVFFAGSAVKNS